MSSFYRKFLKVEKMTPADVKQHLDRIRQAEANIIADAKAGKPIKAQLAEFTSATPDSYFQQPVYDDGHDDKARQCLTFIRIHDQRCRESAASGKDYFPHYQDMMHETDKFLKQTKRC